MWEKDDCIRCHWHNSPRDKHWGELTFASAAFDLLFVYRQDEFWVRTGNWCTRVSVDTSVTGYWRCTSFSVTSQSEISAGSQGSRSSLHFLNWQLEKLYSTGHDKRHGRQRSASQKRERSDKWGRLGGIRADESCWALRNDWQLIMKIWEGSLTCSAKPFSVVSFLFPQSQIQCKKVKNGH